MSFDTIFDYTPAVTGLTAERNEFQLQIAKLTAERDQLQSSGYALAVTDRIIALTIQINKPTYSVDHIDAVLKEIDAIRALSAEDKSVIYFLFTLLDCKKQDFMARMLFNHAEARTNRDIISLRDDKTTPDDVKRIVAKSIFERYILSPVRFEALQAIFKYIK